MSAKLGVWWTLMQVVLGLEFLALAWLIWLNSAFFVSLLQAEQVPGSVIALQVSIVLALVAALIWVGLTFKGALRKNSWVRSSNLTIQILALAGATGVLQGIIGQKSAGVMLLIAALLGVLASLMLAQKPKEDDAAKA